METIGIDPDCIFVVIEQDSVCTAEGIGTCCEDSVMKIPNPVKDVSSWKT